MQSCNETLGQLRTAAEYELDNQQPAEDVPGPSEYAEQEGAQQNWSKFQQPVDPQVAVHLHARRFKYMLHAVTFTAATFTAVNALSVHTATDPTDTAQTALLRTTSLSAASSTGW